MARLSKKHGSSKLGTSSRYNRRPQLYPLQSTSWPVRASLLISKAKACASSMKMRRVLACN